MNRKHFLIATVISFVLLTVIFTPLSGQQDGEYDPWIDYNDDGVVDVGDLSALGQAYGSSGDTTKNVNVTNFPLDEQGNLKVNVTNDVQEAISKVTGYFVIPPASTVGIDLRPPPGEVWVMHFLYVRLIGPIGHAKIILVDSTTGHTHDIKSKTGASSSVTLNAQAEHIPICSNDVYYRLEVYNADIVEYGGEIVYVGKRVI